MPEEPDLSPEEEEILDRNMRKRIEVKKQLRAEQLKFIATRILEALQARPHGMKWAEIRDLFDEKLSDKQIRQALSTLETAPLERTKVEKNGDHSGERWALLAS
jgi:hypothetical protein